MMNDMSSDIDQLQRRRLLTAAFASVAAAGLAACGGGGGTDAPAAAPAPGPAPAPAPVPAPSPAPGGGATKSAKRGIAYDIATAEDMQALSPGVSWWYGWGQKPKSSVPTDHAARYGMDFIPMLWRDFKAADIEAVLAADPRIKYLLLMNEPNLTDQANLTPQAAAQLWPSYEAVAAKTGVKLVGPAITWGTMAGYADPVVWLDAFYAAYKAANANRAPQIDYLAFHWYDYGLKDQLDRLLKYGKPFWVTEMANWHNGDGAAQIDSVAKQKVQMAEMVKLCEDRSDVFRYAWFTGRWDNDTHFTSLLGANGQLTELGQYYMGLPFSSSSGTAAVTCTDMIGGNHGHELTIASADLDATATKVYDIKGSAGHTHSVTLTVANLQSLKAGVAVSVTSSAEPGHSHVISISCS